MRKPRKTKYSDDIKLKIAEMFEGGKSAKAIASQLSIPVWLAYYLEYQGREIKGTLPEKRAYKPREKKSLNGKRHYEPYQGSVYNKTVEDALVKSRDYLSTRFTEDFVEENVVPVPSVSWGTIGIFVSFCALFVYSIISNNIL